MIQALREKHGHDFEDWWRQTFGFGYDSLTGRKLATAGRKPPKLVHNMVFSMPRGTPLHADQGHPYVHVVLKAVSENGERLNSVKLPPAAHVPVHK